MPSFVAKICIIRVKVQWLDRRYCCRSNAVYNRGSRVLLIWYSLTGPPKCSVFSLIITSTRWFEYVKLFASPRARPCVKRPQVYLLYMIQREYPMNNGFSTGEEDSRGNSDQICCLVDDNERCRRPAGNAAYSKRIQKTVAQRRLKLNIDPQVCIMCHTSFNSILHSHKYIPKKWDEI